MIATFGILSLIQLFLLPGMIVIKYLKIDGFWKNLLIVIGVSPFLNYVFVFITTWLGIYTRTTTFILFTIEIIFFIYYYFPVITQAIGKREYNKKVSTFFNSYLRTDDTQPAQRLFIINTLQLSAFILALGGVLFYIKSFAFPQNATFVSYDAVVSWNRWALDWYHNQFPTLTYNYPQLIPTNWSIIYQFIGEDQVKIFVKTFMGLIEVFIPLTIFALGIIKRRAVFFTGTFLTCLLQANFGSLSSGYVDSAVALFGLLSIVFLFLAQDEKEKTKYIYLGALFTAIATVTKQAGFWSVLTYFLLVIILHKEMVRQKIHHVLLKIAAIDLTIIAPWYIYNQIQIRKGLDHSVTQYVVTLSSKNKTILEVVSHAVDHFLVYLKNPLVPGIVLLILLFVLLFLSFKDPFWKKITLIVIFPFMAIWIFIFSYDIRNFNLIVPLIGLSAAVGLHNLSTLNIGLLNKFTDTHSIDIKTAVVKSVGKIESIFAKMKPVYLLIAFLIVILFLPLIYPNSYLIESSIEDQKMNDNHFLNQALYDYQEMYGIDGKILTAYAILNYLPGLEAYYTGGHENQIDYIEKLNQPEVAYGLAKPNSMHPEVKAYYERLEKQNQIKLLFTNGEYIFFSVCHATCE
jgi:hypothetical protein